MAIELGITIGRMNRYLELIIFHIEWSFDILVDLGDLVISVVFSDFGHFGQFRE